MDRAAWHRDDIPTISPLASAGPAWFGIAGGVKILGRARLQLRGHDPPFSPWELYDRWLLRPLACSGVGIARAGKDRDARSWLLAPLALVIFFGVGVVVL